MTTTPDGHQAPPPLSALRSEIDAIDDQILALMERRLALSREVAARKSLEPGLYLWLHPKREAEIIERLVTRAETLPPALVETVWRELMGYSLQAQVTTRLVLFKSEQLEREIRRRFGSAAPLSAAASLAEALEAAGQGQAVAIVDRQAMKGRDLPEGLLVFDIVRGDPGAGEALAIGRIPPEQASPAWGGLEA